MLPLRHFANSRSFTPLSKPICFTKPFDRRRLLIFLSQDWRKGLLTVTVSSQLYRCPRVRRRSRRTFSTDFEIFRRRFDGVVMTCCRNAQLQFFIRNMLPEFQCALLLYLLVNRKNFYWKLVDFLHFLSTTTQRIRLRRQVDVFSTTSDTNPACNKLSDEMVVWLSVCSDVQFVCTWSSWCHCISKPRHLFSTHFSVVGSVR